MSNASSCLRAAAHYTRRSQLAADADVRSTYAELARLWSEIASVARRFDRDRDEAPVEKYEAKTPKSSLKGGIDHPSGGEQFGLKW